MLVLSRKIGERIHIGDNITIEIRRVAGNRVTLALDAPRTVRILRGELNQAAREFRDAAEFQCTLAEEANAGCATPEAGNGHEHDDVDAHTGPEPYAVIHRRLHVIPQLSPAPPLILPAAT